MGNKDEVVCDNLDKDTEYEVYFEYTVVDPASGKEYHLTSNPQYIYTLPFSIPSIVSFEEARKGTSTLSISYEYLDDADYNSLLLTLDILVKLHQNILELLRIIHHLYQ